MSLLGFYLMKKFDSIYLTVVILNSVMLLPLYCFCDHLRFCYPQEFADQQKVICTGFNAILHGPQHIHISSLSSTCHTFMHCFPFFAASMLSELPCGEIIKAQVIVYMTSDTWIINPCVHYECEECFSVTGANHSYGIHFWILIVMRQHLEHTYQQVYPKNKLQTFCIFTGSNATFHSKKVILKDKIKSF